MSADKCDLANDRRTFKHDSCVPWSIDPPSLRVGLSMEYRDLRSINIWFEFESDARFEFDSKVTCIFENFESTAHAVCLHTTNYAHSLFNKNINLCAVCSWDLCLRLRFIRVACTAVARAHTQLPRDNRHWTSKRIPHDSIRYSIRDSIRTEISDSQVPNGVCPTQGRWS